ncbi:MFS transporter [Roseomonas sp. OT10]|uniref:MFS transporter n=1 Tax=Roseomonas cutis TaxID=2897332 RepID=UPI001E3EA1A4|nr:MFS transporter [Roseomonas sp. OT10]UFN49891.1 MFS transporter [Roseomonas sp. OT10]
MPHPPSPAAPVTQGHTEGGGREADALPPAGLRRVPVLAAASFATSTQAFVMAGLLNELAADLGISVAQAGQLATVFALAFGISAPFVTALTAAWPRRGLLVGALGAMALLNLLIVLTHSYAAVLGLRLLCGVAAALVVPAAAATAAGLAPPAQRARALAMVMAGTTAAFLFGLPMGSVTGEVFGWRGAFGFAALLAGGAALAIRLLLPDVPGERSGLHGFRALRRPGVGGGLALTFTTYAAVFSISAFVGPAVNRVSGLTGGQVGIMQALAGVASLAGVPAGAWMAEHGGLRRAWVLPLLVAGAGATQFALLSGAADGMRLAPVLQGAAILAAAGCLFALSPLVQSYLVGLVPEARGVVLAVNSSALFLGQAAGAALGGLGIALIGLPGIGAAAFLMAGLALVVALLQRPRAGG